MPKQTPPKIEHISIDVLIPYANNAKKHSEEQVLQIASSIREFGFNNPVLIDADNGIIAGHGRVMAARKLALETVPCLRLTHLNEAQRRAYILADNRLTETGGGWDAELLKIELETLRDDDLFDVALTGFTGDDLAKALQGDSEDTEEIETSSDESAPGAGVDYLIVGNLKIPLDADEFNGIQDAVNGYAKENGTTFGFGAYLLRKIGSHE